MFDLISVNYEDPMKVVDYSQLRGYNGCALFRYGY
jgi:hypothetical protein